MPSKSASHLLAFAAVTVFAGACGAQVLQNPGTMPDGRRVHFPETGLQHQDKDSATAHTNDAQPQSGVPGKPDAAGAASAPAPAAAAVLPSLLDKPAQPAKVTFSGGMLTVSADNSSLAQILGDLSRSSGMTVNGLGKDQRVFGTYGPSDPRDVLSSLLDGEGYNVLMLGATASGAPQQLLLTARSNAPAASGQINPPPQEQTEDDENPPNNVPIQTPAMPVRPMEPIQQQNPNGTIKTPAQILQELQQMRQQTPQPQQ